MAFFLSYHNFWSYHEYGYMYIYHISYSDFPTCFDTNLLIGQYFSSLYFWAIVAVIPGHASKHGRGYSRATAVPLRLSLANSSFFLLKMNKKRCFISFR